jgi:branched-chain amino acid transport system permease protein
MNAQIAMLLAQAGITTGAVYALLAVAIVLVFTVTRVIFIPQGEFVAFAALTMSALENHEVPGSLWLLIALSLLVLLAEIRRVCANRDFRRLLRAVVLYGLAPCALALAMHWLVSRELPMPAQVALTLATVVPLGPLLYRIAFRPVAHASVLVLLIVSVAVHLALSSLGLIFFGPEGVRTQPMVGAQWQIAGIQVSGQAGVVLGASVAVIALLYWFFRHTMRGKALQATAVNRIGAQLMGISVESAGELAFTLAAVIGCASGILIGPLVTVVYDTGFLIGLKGFVAAMLGGLISYPLAAVGAVLVGLLESYASFWASAYKDVIVFTLIIPVLLWRSLKMHHVEEDEE